MGTSLQITVGANTPIGNYVFTVTASDGSITQQLSLTLGVADFTLTVTPASESVLTGITTNFTMIIGAVGAWTDFVNISCQVSPSVPVGCYNTVGEQALGTYQVPFNAYSTAAGDYTLTIVGSAEGVTHTAPPVTVHVQGASGTVAPTQATIAAGSSAPFNISLMSQNGYTDQFSFSCSTLPTAVSCGFTPNSGTLPANGKLSGALTVSVAAKTGSAHVAPRTDDRDTWIIAGSLLLAFLMLSVAGGYKDCRLNWSLRRLRHIALVASVAMLLVIGLANCGGGSSSSSQPPPPPPPPPPPTVVTVIVQATSPSLTVSLGNITVQIPQ